MSDTDHSRRIADTVVLDLDGTLVDSNYAHVLAWRQAFVDVGRDVAAVAVHRAIGMGGDRLVAHIGGQALEEHLGDEVRRRHAEHLDELFSTITATEGAGELLEELRHHGVRTALASSSDADLTARLLSLVPGGNRLTESRLTGTDVEETKPSGELIERALASVDADMSLAVGDTVWDVKAAARVGIGCIAMLTGGISRAELSDAGAVLVLRDPEELVEHIRRDGGLVLPRERPPTDL